MATTYRRAAAVIRRGGEGLPGSSVGSRKYSNPNSLRGQDAGPVDQFSPLEILVPLLAVVAKTAAALHAQSNGSTVSVAEGSLLGRLRFAVSIYPENSVHLSGPPTEDLLFAFAILNADLLIQPDHALGTWFDRRRNRHVLDVVVCRESLDTVISLGINHGQQAIFDLRQKRGKSRWFLLLRCTRLKSEARRVSACAAFSSSTDLTRHRRSAQDRLAAPGFRDARRGSEVESSSTSAPAATRVGICRNCGEEYLRGRCQRLLRELVVASQQFHQSAAPEFIFASCVRCVPALRIRIAKLGARYVRL